MNKRAAHREIPEAHRASEHLDNERTFLAWVRTTIAMISLGFVIARLSPTLGAAANGSRHYVAKVADKLIEQQADFDTALNCGVQLRERSRGVAGNHVPDETIEPLRWCDAQ